MEMRSKNSVLGVLNLIVRPRNAHDQTRLIVMSINSALFRPLVYEMVYLPLYKVADATFHIQGNDLRKGGEDQRGGTTTLTIKS